MIPTNSVVLKDSISKDSRSIYGMTESSNALLAFVHDETCGSMSLRAERQLLKGRHLLQPGVPARDKFQVETAQHWNATR